ncbi:MAG: endonuclease MutS2 [Lachnospiraceae bacterium]|nr:endonuclease MutS2 [Lachnospiraceae bacterium]
MNDRVLRITEYGKILDALSERATSLPGKEKCLSLLPMQELYDIEKAQEETACAVSYVLKKGAPSFGSNRDFSSAFSALSVGSALSMPELLSLASFLENVLRTRDFGKKDTEEEAPEDALFDLFDCLYPLPSLSAEIRRCILSEEEVADSASAELRRIRREAGSTGDKVHSQLTKMVNVTYASYLQDNVITMRNDRYCLPVRAEYKAQVPGIVHDQSSSGSTFFIEPSAIVELNNHLRTLAIEEKKEIDRILYSLSLQCAEHLQELQADAENMTALDFIFAKASFALAQDAVRPLFNTDHHIDLIKARHPLIPKEQVVPISLRIGEEYNMIIITGPNTGGKTVTLKTVGLLSLMGMAGLHIPAADRSALSVFREIYADIGDEQSIEQNLSTFSSHMATITQILADVTKDDLCLFDELGAGTDPTEGAALAISILDHLHGEGVTALATTHYSELKVYAMRTAGVVNASCEFDIETLAPTYRLMVGVPGKSNAFAISQRLGLPSFLIDAAKDQLNEDTKQFEEVLAELEAAKVSAASDREAVSLLRKELTIKEKELKNRQMELAAKREKILQKANEEARDILQAAKEEADEAISYLRKHGGDVSSMEKVRSSLREKVTEKSGKIAAKQKDASPSKKLDPAKLKIGDKVFVHSLKLNGTVHSLPDKEGRLVVTCGIMQSRVTLSDLSPVEEETVRLTSEPKSSLKKAFAKQASGSASAGSGAASLAISPELNLLGMTTDDALLALDKYLDDARLAHLHSVRIVHGKGTGALRQAVQKYLKKQKWIASFRSGEFGEGDAGVTVVRLTK